MPNLNYTIRIAIAGKRKHNGLTNLENDGRVEKILGILNEMHNKLLNKTANDKPTDDEKDIYNKIAPGSELKVLLDVVLDTLSSDGITSTQMKEEVSSQL